MTPSIGERSDGVVELLPGEVALGVAAARAPPDDCGLPRARPGSGLRRSAAAPPPTRGRRGPRCRAARTSRCARAGVRASSSDGLRLAHEPGLFDVDGVAAADRVESQPRARLLQRGLRLTQAQIEIGRRQPREHLAALRPSRPRSTSSSSRRPVTFRLSITCSSAASVPVTVTDAAERRALDADDVDRLASSAGVCRCAPRPKTHRHRPLRPRQTRNSTRRIVTMSHVSPTERCARQARNT